MEADKNYEHHRQGHGLLEHQLHQGEYGTELTEVDHHQDHQQDVGSYFSRGPSIFKITLVFVRRKITKAMSITTRINSTKLQGLMTT